MMTGYNNDSMKKAEKLFKEKDYMQALSIYENLLEEENAKRMLSKDHPDSACHAYNMRLLKQRIDECRDKLADLIASTSNAEHKSRRTTGSGVKDFFCGLIVAVMIICCIAFIANVKPEWIPVGIGEDIAVGFRTVGESISAYLATYNLDLLKTVQTYVDWPDVVVYCILAFIAILLALLVVRSIVLKVVNLIEKCRHDGN